VREPSGAGVAGRATGGATLDLSTGGFRRFSRPTVAVDLWWSGKHRHHLVPVRRAISALGSPSAASSTIRARDASPRVSNSTGSALPADWLTPSRLATWLRNVAYTGRKDPAVLHAHLATAAPGATGPGRRRGRAGDPCVRRGADRDRRIHALDAHIDALLHEDIAVV
jgi:hypothetical protein